MRGVIRKDFNLRPYWDFMFFPQASGVEFVLKLAGCWRLYVRRRSTWCVSKKNNLPRWIVDAAWCDEQQCAKHVKPMTPFIRLLSWGHPNITRAYTPTSKDTCVTCYHTGELSQVAAGRADA